MPKKPSGMADVAWEAYQLASANANIDISTRADARVVQALGYAEKSKGFHAPDGTLKGKPYTAAMDLSVRGLTDNQIATWMDEMARAGIGSFFRDPDDPLWRNNGHIHGFYCGLPMKPQLDSQVRDYKKGLNGLVSHKPVDGYFYPTPELVNICWNMFLRSNVNGDEVVRTPLYKKVPEPAQSYALYLGDNTTPTLWMPVIDGSSMVPVRAFGTALGFDVSWNPKTKRVIYNGQEKMVAITNIAGVGHAPIRQIAWATGLHVEAINVKSRKVIVAR